jgi:hypothetical protein
MPSVALPGIRRLRSSAAVLATMFAAPLPEVVEEAKRQGAAGLVGVVGHWTDTTAGTPAVVVNGERWSGSTTAEELRRTGNRLFGNTTDTFIANGSAAGAFQFAVATSVSEFRNGTLRVQFNLLGGKTDQIAGLLFGLGPSGEYFYIRYNTRDDNLAVWKFANGERTVLSHGEVHKRLTLGSWHELVVELRGRQVRGHIAGDPTISVEHTLDVDPVGRVGVWAKRDAITAFRAFTASPSRQANSSSTQRPLSPQSALVRLQSPRSSRTLR